jgi:hypothetical protein
MLPHVDLFLPAHNIESIGQLSRALQQDVGQSGRRITTYQAAQRHP